MNYTTAEVRRWARDSKIVDATGAPLLMWHGTPAKFQRFDERFLSPSGAFGPGFYFTNDYALAKMYSDGSEPVAAYLSIKNPWTKIHGEQKSFRGMAGRLEAHGYDGVLVLDDDYVEAVAIRASQILVVTPTAPLAASVGASEMNYGQRAKIEAAAVAIARKLGRAAGDEDVRSTGCESIGLMGSYELSHFGLADFEAEFVQRLGVTLERLNADRRTAAEIKDSAWRSWVAARNARVRERCPRAKVYGSD